MYCSNIHIAFVHQAYQERSKMVVKMFEKRQNAKRIEPSDPYGSTVVRCSNERGVLLIYRDSLARYFANAKRLAEANYSTPRSTSQPCRVV